MPVDQPLLPDRPEPKPGHGSLTGGCLEFVGVLILVFVVTGLLLLLVGLPQILSIFGTPRV